MRSRWVSALLSSTSISVERDGRRGAIGRPHQDLQLILCARGDVHAVGHDTVLEHGFPPDCDSVPNYGPAHDRGAGDVRIHRRDLAMLRPDRWGAPVIADGADVPEIRTGDESSNRARHAREQGIVASAD